jgi:hypothetical protein
MKKINPWNTFFGSMVPNWLMEQNLNDISFGAKLCYGRLVQFGGKAGVAFPKMNTLANQIGCSERQARRFVSELHDLKLIHVVDRRSRGLPHQITFLEHEWMPPIEARKSPKVGKGGARKPRTDLSGGYRTDPAGGSGQIRPDKEETHGRGSKGKGSLSAAGAAGGVASPDPALPGSSKTEDPACSPSVVDGVPQAKESGVLLRKQHAEAAAGAKAVSTNLTVKEQNRKRATRQVERDRLKEQKAANLKGKVHPPSKRKQRERCESLWFELMNERYPDITFAKEWDGTERAQCHTLIDRYSGPIIEQALHYLITEWDGISERMLKKAKKGIPGMKFLTACHSSIVPEAQQFAAFAEVKAEREAWFAANPHSVHLPADLKKRYAAAKKVMEGLAA